MMHRADAAYGHMRQLDQPDPGPKQGFGGHQNVGDLGSALDVISDIFLLIDVHGQLRAANAHARAVLGIQQGDLPGRSIWDVVPATAGRAIRRALSVVARDRTAQSFDIRLHDDSSTTWYAGHAYPGPEGIVLHLHDVTVRRKLEDDLAFLAQSGAELAGVLSQSELASTVARQMAPRLGDWSLVALQENDSGSFRSDAAPPSSELRQRVTESLTEPGAGGDATRALLRYGMSMNEPRVFTRSEVPRRLRASALWLLASLCLVIPIRHSTKRMGVALVGREAGWRRYRHDEMRVGRELATLAGLVSENVRLMDAERSATSLREEVLTFVAHDLRSSVNAVMLGATALPEREVTLAPELYAAARRAVISATSQMTRMLDDMVSAARLDAGWTPRQTQVVELASLAEETVDTFRVLADHRGVRLALRLDARPTTRVDVDPHKLQEAIGNVLDNALKFTPAGGSVTVCTSCIRDRARLSVIDTGCGIEPSALPHVFDRFWQLRPNSHKGAGLGLFIAQRIVQGHGGEILVESTVDKGTAFHLELPRVRGGREAQLADSPQLGEPA